MAVCLQQRARSLSTLLRVAFSRGCEARPAKSNPIVGRGQRYVNPTRRTVIWLAFRPRQEDTMLDQPKLKLFTKHAFAALGYSEIAYLKRVEADGDVYFVAHAADGSVLAEFSDRDAACATLVEHDLLPVSVH